MKKYYELLNLNENATAEEVEAAFNRLTLDLYEKMNNKEIRRSEYNASYDALVDARDNVISDIQRKAAGHTTGAGLGTGNSQTGTGKDPDNDNLDDDLDNGHKKNKSGKGKKIALKVGAAVVAGALVIGALAYGHNKKMADTGANFTGQNSLITVDAEQYQNGSTESTQGTETDETVKSTETTDETVKSTENAEESEDYSNQVYVEDLGDINDDTLVTARAQELVDNLNAAGIVNPDTTTAYTVDQIKALILYANGVYTPSSQEEIDVLHLNLLNLLIAQINTDDYLYHVVYATGNDDFTSLLNPDVQNVGFSEAFAAYGENGVYPLIQWLEQKRFDMYSSTDRDEINSIYREVGQVMADLMKGNGCTITIKEGKEAKEGITYTFTSEQVLANHATAMLVTTEAQLVFANHYEIRNENNEIIDQTSTTWEVENKLNTDGVDENGNPIYVKDQVTYDEINAWINNGCDYEWDIDEAVLIDGQTFGQRIQSDMEGMALNNYSMNSDTKKLTK